MAKQQLDLYLPTRSQFTTVLLIHGGSLTEGDRKEPPFPAVGEAFARAGFGCAVMSYRLGPENKWPAQPLDVTAATAWLKRNIASYGGNPARLYLIGHSSGALLAVLVGTDSKYLGHFGLTTRDVTGVVAMGSMLHPSYDADGIPDEQLAPAFARDVYMQTMGTPAAYRDADPYRHINAAQVPLLILVAETERFQPPILEQATAFKEASRKVGAHVAVEVLANRTHMTALAKLAESGDPTFELIRRFIQTQARQDPAPTGHR